LQIVLIPVVARMSGALVLKIGQPFLIGVMTEMIGIHALFGAFIAGTIVPTGRLRTYCKEKFESVATNLLLPLFLPSRDCERNSD
jgi:Kef-type K+ transport system membrane component KefB